MAGWPAGTSGPLGTSRDGPLLLLTLDRPERLNAVTPELYERLSEVLRGVENDASVRAVVVTGRGRAFSVGADLRGHDEAPLEGDERVRYVELAQEVNHLLQTLPKPVVAAVNGHAVGAGLELALSADFMVVARDAKLRLPELGLGTFFGGGVTYTLAERVGVARAREILLLGEPLSGEDAERMGLACRAVDADEVLNVARDVAETLATRAPVAMAHAKRLLGRVRDLSRREALQAEARALLECMETEDWKEGIRAFHEKREPRFRGR